MHDSAAVKLDGIDVAFDDERAVSDAGALLAGTLAGRLGIEALVERTVCLGERPGAANPGAKVMSLVSAMALGADSIDDCDLLRAARSAQVLGHRVAAPSTTGTFLRSFTWGHARQLDKVAGELLKVGWATGAGPGDAPVTIDVDSTICETYGTTKQGGSKFTHTKCVCTTRWWRRWPPRLTWSTPALGAATPTRDARRRGS